MAATEPSVALQHLPAGVTLGGLKIQSVLGSGGSAVTYRATDVRTRAQVALKEYFPRRWAVRRLDGTVSASTPSFVPHFRAGLQRFITEAEILARFRAPGIVEVHRVFASMGTGYMQLAYLDGPTLASWLELGRPPPQQTSLDTFARRVTESLALIHTAGILHCDIGPRNIILNESGLPILIDFGSARLSTAQECREPAVLVTPHYAPQELYDSTGAQRGPWTDIYATAAVLYRLVVGAPPAPAPERALGAQRIMLSAVPQLQSYRTQFLAAIDWGLEFLPARRPRSVAQWAAMLLPQGAGPLRTL